MHLYKCILEERVIFLTLREQTCCFTGHRTIPKEELPELMIELEHILQELIAGGIRYFGAGGALGFDMIAAETVLRLRERWPYIRLILVLPCQDQNRGWRPADTARYELIKARANKVVYTAQIYGPDCMHRRNRHLVDNSSVCVAYCHRSSGGSAYTVDYAQRRGLRVILLGKQ